MNKTERVFFDHYLGYCTDMIRKTKVNYSLTITLTINSHILHLTVEVIVISMYGITLN